MKLNSGWLADVAYTAVETRAGLRRHRRFMAPRSNETSQSRQFETSSGPVLVGPDWTHLGSRSPSTLGEEMGCEVDHARDTLVGDISEDPQGESTKGPKSDREYHGVDAALRAFLGPATRCGGR
jgi:hypothetical protein